MCEYCEHKKQLLTKFEKYECWGRFEYEESQLIIDRGYLRLGQTDDMNCIDSGIKVKINYCPMCGCRISKVVNQMKLSRKLQLLPRRILTFITFDKYYICEECNKIHTRADDDTIINKQLSIIVSNKCANESINRSFRLLNKAIFEREYNAEWRKIK